MSTVRPDPTKPPCACGSLWFARGMCRVCYWQDYNARHPDRQAEYNCRKRRGRLRRQFVPAIAPPPPKHLHRSVVPYWKALGICGHQWCRRSLPVRVVNGVVEYLDCPRCARFKQGLCYECGKPLRDTDRYTDRTRARSRWHMDRPHGCYWRRRKAALAEANRRHRERYLERHRQRDRAKSGPTYAKERKAVLRFNQARRKALPAKKRGRYRRIEKVKPCPECGGRMPYITCPPKRCDPCWDRIAQSLQGGDA